MKQEREVFTIEEEYVPDFFEDEVQEEPQKYEQQQNVVVKKEIERFDDYSHERADDNYEEYEVIKSYRPKTKQKQNKEFKQIVDSQYDFTPSNETFIYQRSKTKNVVSSKVRSKILVYCCAFIAVLLSALCIVNVVNMTTTNLSNSRKQTEISTIDKNITNAGETIDDIEDEIKQEANKTSYVSSDNANSYSISLIEKKQLSLDNGHTNFFDRICNFISNMFGG